MDSEAASGVEAVWTKGSRGFVCCTGDSAITDVFVVDGDPAIGVVGVVEPVTSVADDEGTSTESEETSA